MTDRKPCPTHSTESIPCRVCYWIERSPWIPAPAPAPEPQCVVVCPACNECLVHTRKYGKEPPPPAPQDVAGLIATMRERAARDKRHGWDADAADWEQAAAALAQERKDWARRFKLNDVTPWEWMTRATQAERERDEAREDAAKWMQRATKESGQATDLRVDLRTIRQDAARAFSYLANAPGLPLEDRTLAELEQWTNAVMSALTVLQDYASIYVDIDAARKGENKT